MGFKQHPSTDVESKLNCLLKFLYSKEKKKKKSKRIRDRTGGAENDPSARAFRESEDDDLGDILVDSERAGQESAPMTGPDSLDPLSGIFQASFFFPRGAAAAALPLLPWSGLPDGSGGADDEAAFSTGEGERSEASEEEIGAGVGGEEGPAGTASGSPRTTRAQGEENLPAPPRTGWGARCLDADGSKAGDIAADARFRVPIGGTARKQRRYFKKPR